MTGKQVRERLAELAAELADVRRKAEDEKATLRAMCEHEWCLAGPGMEQCTFCDTKRIVKPVAESAKDVAMTETVVWHPGSLLPPTQPFTAVVIPTFSRQPTRASFENGHWHWDNGQHMDVPPLYWADVKGPEEKP